MLFTRLIERIADRFGLATIPKSRLDSYFLSRRLARIISEYGIDCIFDVGSNIGQYRNFLRTQVGYNGLIISFEPAPDCIEKLVEAGRNDSNWVIQGYALGKSSCRRNLNLMQSSLFNSFLEPSADVGYFSAENRVVKTAAVEVKRLDEIIEELKQRYHFDRAFLKMDTQGFDLEVFEGAAGCLGCIYGVQTEVPVISIYENMPSLADSLKVFKSKGFEVSGLYSLSEARFPFAIEFDCVYLPAPHATSTEIAASN